MDERMRQMLIRVRAEHPEAIAVAARQRARRPVLGSTGRLMILAADHPARGILGVRGRSGAMVDRVGLLDRLMTGLAGPVSTACWERPISSRTC